MRRCVCVEGAGRSKKAAKRNAAAKMMAHIKSVSGAEGDQPPQVEDSDEEEEMPLVGHALSNVICESSHFSMVLSCSSA